MAIDPSAVGAVTKPQLFEWTDRDTLLYALGVGAGLDRLVEGQPVVLQREVQLVGDLVEPAAERADRRRRHLDGPHETAVAGGVAAVVGAEHAPSRADAVPPATLR